MDSTANTTEVLMVGGDEMGKFRICGLICTIAKNSWLAFVAFLKPLLLFSDLPSPAFWEPNVYSIHGFCFPQNKQTSKKAQLSFLKGAPTRKANELK